MTESWKDLAKQLMWEMTPQDNYHGSPYTFNKFDDSKWLTGEGAMGHGPGHYSADLFDTANKYNTSKLNVPENFVDRYDLPSRFLDLDKDTQRFAIKNKIHQLNTFASDTSYPEQIRQSWIRKAQELKNILDNPSYIEGNTYRVNVPNENFMWKERLPLSEQTPYVRDAWYKNNFDYGKLLNDWSIDHDLEGVRLPNDKKFWRVYNKSIEHYGEIKPILRRIFSNQMQVLDLPDQLKFLARSGNLDKLKEAMGDIKGIRAIGHEDGPINVTFSGDNIKMANTPWQRFVNRIPKQTLGKMANKIVTSPAFKSFIDVSPALGVGAEYLKPLDIIRSTGDNKKQKIQQMFNDAGYELEIQPDGTYLFKM